MIEILFTESAAGSIQYAKRIKNVVDSSTSVFIRKADRSEVSPEELAPEQARVEDELRKKHEIAVPMEGNLEDILCFPLNLSMGDISDPFSDFRVDFLQSMVLIAGDQFADVGREMMNTARNSLERLRSATGPIRLWFSHQPDEFCGFCHVLTLLPEDADIRVVELPDYEVLGSEVRTYTGWGDIEPTELGRFQALERPLGDTERRYFAGLWQQLQSENGVLRAVVNGRLCTVEEDFYDGFLLRELQQQPLEFHEGRLVGTILGQYGLGISDSLVALRLEEFISRGMLVPITEPEENHPIYHRWLRKVSVC